MMKLDNFVGMMTGHFDNKDQFNKMQAEGKTYPYAEHVNTICTFAQANSRICVGKKSLFDCMVTIEEKEGDKDIKEKLTIKNKK